MATAQAIIMKNVLNDYVSNLHRYLGPYCFTKGAFVIEDDGTLLELLNKNKRAQINGLFRSHKSFLQGSEPIFECDIDLYLECDGCQPGMKDRVHVKNIKWYPFDQNAKKYIYFKLEGHPTFSKMGSVSTVNVSHAIQYAKKVLFDKEGPCKKRREDCKPKDCLSNAKELNHKFYQMDQNVPVAIEESHTRAGSEIFIPLGVSQYFLKNIDKKMNFQFQNGTVMITLDTTPNVEVLNEPIATEEEEEEVYEPEPEPPQTVGGKMSRKRMPYSIRKLPNRRLYTVKGPGRTFAKATTLKKAKAQVRLLYDLERRNTKGTRRQK